MVAAGTEAGVVRVGSGFAGLEAEEAVEGVTPSGLAAVMGAFLWMGIGGMLKNGIGVEVMGNCGWRSSLC